MSSYHWNNLQHISSCHETPWISRDERNGIQLDVCVCVCVSGVLCLPTYPSSPQGQSGLIQSISGASQQEMRRR